MLPIEVAKMYIEQCDFSKIIDKLVNYHGWAEHEAEAIAKKYRRFLWLVRKYYQTYSLIPSLEINEFWRFHILDTRRYRTDCQHIFGQYFDHDPYAYLDDHGDPKDEIADFQLTLELYQKEFGEPLFQSRNGWSRVLFQLRGAYLCSKTSQDSSGHFI